MTAIAALALASCAMEEQTEESVKTLQGDLVTLRFAVGAEDTKTSFGKFDEGENMYPTRWTASDQKVCMSMNMNDPVEADVIKPSSESYSAEFAGVFTRGTRPYKFYALSPVSSVNGISDSRSSWSVTIPSRQTPTADGLSCDEKAMIIYAESANMLVLPSADQPIRMQMHHVPAYCRLALKNIASTLATFEASDAKVKSVDISFGTPVAGDWYINVSDGSLTPKDASRTISINCEIEDASQPTDLWFAMAPCVLDGQKVKVSVNTDKGSLNREFTFGTRTYEAGTVNKLSVDMSKDATFDKFSYTKTEVVYELVTSVNNLSVNDELIFVDATTPSYAMTGTTSTSGFASVAKDNAQGFTYSPSTDSYIRLPEGSSVAVWTVASKSSSSLTFKRGTQYLANSSSNAATLSSTAQTFTVSISSGTATLRFTKSSGWTTYTYSLYRATNGYFTYNRGSNGATKTMAIYKKKTNTVTENLDPDSDPVCSKDAFGAYLLSENLLYVSGLSELSRERDAQGVTFAILNQKENQVVEFSGITPGAAKGEVFDLSVKTINGKSVTNLGTFNVTVVKEEGAKLWLSDFKGNGFIVKR